MSSASSSNSYTKTFGGIDGAGKRLAEEVSFEYFSGYVCCLFCIFSIKLIYYAYQVRQIVQRTESLKKISFLAHSLGGLFARYAVAVLYTPNNLGDGDIDDTLGRSMKHGVIAGLEPINFITLASPHLGVRGRKQVSNHFESLQFLAVS